MRAHILIWRLKLCQQEAEEKEFCWNQEDIGSYEIEQEDETEAGLWGHDYMQMGNKTVKENLKSGRLDLYLYSTCHRIIEC